MTPLEKLDQIDALFATYPSWTSTEIFGCLLDVARSRAKACREALHSQEAEACQHHYTGRCTCFAAEEIDTMHALWPAMTGFLLLLVAGCVVTLFRQTLARDRDAVQRAWTPQEQPYTLTEVRHGLSVFVASEWRVLRPDGSVAREGGFDGR